MRIEHITKENFNVYSLENFSRTQQVKRIYKKINNTYEIVECNFVMDWDAEKKRNVATDLLSDDCIAYMAKDGNMVTGFSSVYKTLQENYMIVDLVQVDAFARKQGLGRNLFQALVHEGQMSKAKGLYISACPAEETIRFYLAMNCMITDTPIQSFVDEEPNDVQMVYLF